MTELAPPSASEAAPLGYSELAKTQAERRAELRRMRTIATMLLVLMAAIFLLMRRAPAGWAWGARSRRVRGSGHGRGLRRLVRRRCALSPSPRPADFRTAVVPENKRRIGAALGRFITNNFLGPQVAIARLASVDAVGLAARWLEDERNVRVIAAGAGCVIPYALDLVPKAAIDEWVAYAARRGVEAVPVAPLASRGLSILWADGAGLIRCSTRASISPRRCSTSTRRRSCDMCRRSRRDLSRNGSTT